MYLLAGAFAGLAAGMLGIGGGLIIVPALTSLFLLQGMPADIIMHLALATSLATIVVTSIASIISHHRHQAVLWFVFWQLTPGILLGASLGGWLAGQMSGDWLKPVFGLFELTVAIYMLTDKTVTQHRSLPGIIPMSSAGTVIGGLSAIVGIGGGTLTVPYLCWNSVQIRNAIATSAACGLPIALAGAMAYMLTGWQQPGLPANTLGYIHLPALLGIILSSVLFAPLGARLTHRLPVKIIKKIFAVFLLAVAFKLLVTEF
ncbi:MAG: sulfite exporter TauE/SafE family protein [Gammaproteobacteria bacterium]|nr:sulfite exporter TauE/SafE family protein [Gammaproteobacteria bacterium]